MIQVSVVIPTFNRADSLTQVLHFLSQQTLDPNQFEVIVVDDGSSDHTSAVIDQIDMPNLCYRKQQNQGEIAARNLGVSLARGKLLAFIDDDVFVASTYLEALLDAHNNTEKRIVIGRIHEYFDPTVDPRELLQAHVIDKDASRAKRVAYVNCSGHSFSVTRAGYQEIGGMIPLDKGRNAWGGIDFAHRAQRFGYQVYRAPLAFALHHDCFSKDYQTFTSRWERTSSMAVLLHHRYPDLKGRIPMLRDKHEIDWKRDAPALIARKLVKRLLGIGVITRCMDWATLNAPEPWRRRAAKLGIEGHLVRGYRHGLRRYGSVPYRSRSNESH